MWLLNFKAVNKTWWASTRSVINKWEFVWHFLIRQLLVIFQWLSHQDKDLEVVIQESLRTTTRINVTAIDCVGCCRSRVFSSFLLSADHTSWITVLGNEYKPVYMSDVSILHSWHFVWYGILCDILTSLLRVRVIWQFVLILLTVIHFQFFSCAFSAWAW